MEFLMKSVMGEKSSSVIVLFRLWGFDYILPMVERVLPKEDSRSQFQTLDPKRGGSLLPSGPWPVSFPVPG